MDFLFFVIDEIHAFPVHFLTWKPLALSPRCVFGKPKISCQDLATPTASPAEPRGRSPTLGEVGKDVAPRGNQKKSQELGPTGSRLKVELAVA